MGRFDGLCFIALDQIQSRSFESRLWEVDLHQLRKQLELANKILDQLSEELTRQLKETPTDENVRLRLAAVRYRLGRFAEAIENLARRGTPTTSGNVTD